MLRRLNRFFLVILLLAAWAAPALAAEGESDLANALYEGQKHLAQKEPESALAAFRHAVELSGGKSFAASVNFQIQDSDPDKAGEASPK